MLSIIIHQVIWGFFSFCLFFLCMNKFVISKIITSQKRRKDYINSIKEQIAHLEEKTRLLNQISFKIINEEIPIKQNMYVDRKIEPIVREMEIEILNVKNTLNEKLTKISQENFNSKIDFGNLLDQNVEKFLNQVNK